MSAKFWVVGDIHGCYNELMGLYRQFLERGMKPKTDILVFLGDYIDRGHDSPKVVEQMIRWKERYPHWIFLSGNHEDMFADYIFSDEKNYGKGCWEMNGGDKTLSQYCGDIPEEHIKFLTTPRFYYDTKKYFFVHGGILPGHPIKDSYDYPAMMLWAREKFINSDYDWGKKIIFGHTPRGHQPIIMKNKIGIDGACCRKGNLIGLKLPDEKFYFEPYHKIQA